MTAQYLSRVDDILTELGVQYSWENNTVYGPCPVHDGNNPNAFRLYLNDTGSEWCCFTRNCNEEKGKYGLIGLVFGILQKDNPAMTREGAIKWLDNFVGSQPAIVKPKQNLAQFVKKSNIGEFPKMTRKEIRNLLMIPANYYLNRNYSKEVLDKYDVGFCDNFGKRMYKRAVVPVYDPAYKFTIGCTGRSIFEKCPKCEGFHHPLRKICPQVAPKWLHDKRFAKSEYLYNWWFCRPSIKKTRKVFVVEGPGDVWRLVEAGIDNCVAIMGAKISTQQSILLETSGATDIILVRDNDKAGEKCLESAKKKLGKFFRIHCVVPSSKDIGELQVKQVREELGKYL